MEQTFGVGYLKITYDLDLAQPIRAVEVDLTPTVVPKYTDITFLVMHSPKAVQMVEKLIFEFDSFDDADRFESPEFLTFKILHSGKINS
jgi:hypothetical protein